MSKELDLPANYQTVMPYLIVKNAAGFMKFTKDVFGAEEMHRAMRDESIIMHGEVMIGGSTIMFADSTDAYTELPAGMFVYVSNADETFAKAKEAGATVVAELSNQSYGRTCGITDPFGNTWWITSVIEEN